MPVCHICSAYTSLFLSSWFTCMPIGPPTPILSNSASVLCRVLPSVTAFILSKYGCRGFMPSCSIFAESIATVQKSPIFCSVVPSAPFAFAAFSAIVRRRLRFSSITSPPMPQLLWSAGIGLAFIHPPLA